MLCSSLEKTKIAEIYFVELLCCNSLILGVDFFLKGINVSKRKKVYELKKGIKS